MLEFRLCGYGLPPLSNLFNSLRITQRTAKWGRNKYFWVQMAPTGSTPVVWTMRKQNTFN